MFIIEWFLYAPISELYQLLQNLVWMNVGLWSLLLMEYTEVLNDHTS